MAAAEAKMENVAAGATTFAPNVVKTTASATALSSLCFIELCAGSARLSSMMRARGFQVTAVDHKTDTSPNIQYSPLT